jgi:hypothetical protein
LQSCSKFCGVRAVSRYKEYRSQKSITGYKTVSGHWSSIAVQTISEPEIYHVAGVRLRAAARIRMQEPLEICLDAGAKCKTYDKQLTFSTYEKSIVSGTISIIMLNYCS